MANATPSRLGQIGGSGDNLAIFLKMFSGEVLATFDRTAVYKPHTTVRSISSGKSAQFPATGILTGYYHNPGDEILGDKILNGEVAIPIEGLYIAPYAIASIDDAMAQYDYRSIYSDQVGQALSKFYDQNVSRVAANAARVTVPNVKGVFAGDALTSTIVNAALATDGTILTGSMYDAGVTLDTRDVPVDDRIYMVDPLRYALLVKAGLLTDVRFNEMSGQLGGLVTGAVKGIRSTPVIQTNNYAKTNDLLNANMPTSRQHDYSTSQFQLFHKSAVGTVNLRDIDMEMEWDMRRQVWLGLGKYIAGHGVLRPEAAFEGLSGAAAG